MGKRYFAFVILMFCLMLSACSSITNTVKCTTGKSNVKNKRFSQKKNKKRYRPISYASSGSSAPRQSASVTSSPPPPPPTPIQAEIAPEPSPEEEAEPTAVTPIEQEEPIATPISERQTEVPVAQMPPDPEPEPVYEIIEETPVSTTAERTPDPISQENVIETPAQTPPVAKKKISVSNKPATRSVTISPVKVNPKSEFVSADLEPGQLKFRGKVYEKDDRITFNQFVVFMPNHDIILNPGNAKKKIDDLVRFMKAYPEKKVTVIGNAGWDNFDEDDPDWYYDYQENPYTGEVSKIHYGRGPLVYGQTVFVSDQGNYARLRAEGVRPVESVVLGEVMRDRAIRIKELLIAQGISKKRISTSLGEFFRSADRHVTFVIR